MKKTAKIILAMLLTICMALPMFVMSISAESGSQNGIDWVYDADTKVLTLTANGATMLPAISGSAWETYKDSIKEVVLKNGTSEFTALSYACFQLMGSLVKVTIPASVTEQVTAGGTGVGKQIFNGSPNIKELVVEGNAYIPGAIDYSNITDGDLSDTTNHRTFEGTNIETLILPYGIYSDDKEIVVSHTNGTNMFGNSLKTIMGSYGDTYLSKFAEDNGCKYVPYGKIGEGTAWTYDANTKTVTIYGKGTNTHLTALSETGAAYPAGAENLIIRSDITSIDGNALAGLTSLKTVKFEGNAPETTGNPFGTITGLTVAVSLDSTGFDATWCGYTVSKVDKGSYNNLNPTGSNIEWEYDLGTKVLTLTANDGAYMLTAGLDLDWGKKYLAEIEEVVVKNGTSEFTTLRYGAFRDMTSLIRVTLPKTVDTVDSNNRLIFYNTKIEELVVEGNTYVPGAIDLSNIKTPFLATANHNTFGNTHIKTLILPGGVYDATTNPIAIAGYGDSLKTIMGPEDEYLRQFAKDNNLTFIPYDGSSWYIEGTFGTDGNWQFDVKNETLYVWTASGALKLQELVADANFAAFAKGEYSASVKILKLYNKDSSYVVTTIESKRDGSSNFGFRLLVQDGINLNAIEEIYVGGTGENQKEVTFTEALRLFENLNNLTTFGKEGTEKGTVDLTAMTFSAGASNYAFSGQDGIEKVILPMADTWGLPYTNGDTYSTWANIPANHFAGMTGLKEVVLNSSTINRNNGTVDESYLGAYYRGTCAIGANAFSGCTSLKSITIPQAAPATATLRRNVAGATDYVVDLFNADTFTGSSIETVYIWNPDADVVAEYDISYDKNIICANDGVKEAILADSPNATVSCVFEGVGIKVRYEGYNGMRFIYNFNNVIDDTYGYELVEYGAMIVAQSNLKADELTINASELTLVVNGSAKRAVWNNEEEWVGKVLSYNEETEDTQFAITLRDFTANWDDAVYSRAYAVYEDAYGNRFVAYEDEYDGEACSFYDVMVGVCQMEELKAYVCEDAAIWDVLKAGGNGVETEVDASTIAMVIDGAAEDAAKILVVRKADGTIATETDIANAKTAADVGDDVDVIALQFVKNKSK